MLSDQYWEKLLKLMRHTGRIYNKPEHRKTFEAILFRMRVGCPWRDIPEHFGQWSAIYRRFNFWSKKGIFTSLFDYLKTEPDLEWIFIDGSIVKAHQHSAGAASEDNEAIGRSVAGNTTKIHMAVDSYGLPIDFILTGGEVHDSKMASELIEMLPDSKYIVADKGYDSEAIRDKIRSRKSTPVIPRKKTPRLEMMILIGVYINIVI
jgi:transposase